MRGVRVRVLRKIATRHFLNAQRKFPALQFKTFFRWVKESYNRGTLQGY